jgi:hypothetical protein
MAAFDRFEKDVIWAMALASGATQAVAAEQAGTSPRTIRRKLARPEFRQLVADLRAELIGQALGRMANNMTRAADSLGALLDSEDERVRLRTCRALLSLGLKMRDSVDLTERVREIEAEIARKQGAAA